MRVDWTEQPVPDVGQVDDQGIAHTVRLPRRGGRWWVPAGTLVEVEVATHLVKTLLSDRGPGAHEVVVDGLGRARWADAEMMRVRESSLTGPPGANRITRSSARTMRARGLA